MKTLKYPIAVAALALFGVASASAADYVYGNTTNASNTMNDSRNWFEVSSFEGLTGYEGLTRLSETNTKFAPGATDNLLVKNFNMSDLIGEYYQPADALLSDSGSVYNMRSQSFGFQATPDGANLFEVNNLTFSVDHNYVLNENPRTAAQNANIELNFHWRPQGTDGNVKINGTFTLEKSSKLTIQGDSATAGKWNVIDIGHLVMSTSGAGARSQLNMTSYIKEIRIGVTKNDVTGEYTANGTNSVVGNGSWLQTAVTDNYGADMYIGNLVMEANTRTDIKGVIAHMIGNVVVNGEMLMMHHNGTGIVGDMTIGTTGTLSMRLGTYNGTLTNNGAFNMNHNENPHMLAAFDGHLINNGTFNFGRGTFTGTIENTKNLNLKRGDAALPVAVMTADVINSSSMAVSTDVQFYGSIQANSGSTTTFAGTSKGDITGKRLFFNNATISVSETAKLTIFNSELRYNLATGNPSLLLFAAITNIDALSDIFETDFKFMNISEGKFDLIKFLDGNMYSSLADLIGDTFEYKDLVTYDLYEGTFVEDTSGVFSIVFVLIPEPSTYAAIFGLLALALAVYRRRK